MWKKFTALFALNRDDLWIALGMSGLPFLLVHLVTAGVMVLVRPDESIFVGGMLLPFSVGIAAFSVTAGNVQVTFSQAVRFSATRKHALVLTLGLAGSLTALSAALGCLLIAFERGPAMDLWRVLSRNPELLVDDFGFVWWAIPLGAVVGFTVGLLYGAALLRFGGLAVAGFMIIWFGGIAGVQLLPWKTHEVTNILLPALVLLGVLGVVWSVWTMLHHSVTK